MRNPSRVVEIRNHYGFFFLFFLKLWRKIFEPWFVDPPLVNKKDKCNKYRLINRVHRTASNVSRVFFFLLNLYLHDVDN